MAVRSYPYEASAAMLEAGVDDQIANNSYDFIGNKALLKMYQVSPDLANLSAVVKVLVLALMHLPSSDFLALTYLLGKLESSPKIQQVIKLAESLDTANYSNFWAELNNESAADVAAIKGIHESIRKMIVSNLQSSHRSMGVKELTLSLGLDANASAALASTYPQIEKVIFISMSSYMSTFKYFNRLRTELSYSLHVKGIKRDLNSLRRRCDSMR
jgi:hypothetical protein